MKTMLHKSFKPAKCKTSLRLATSRIKLMKNKKGVQINQMKKELAQLLDTGKDRTARIQVEHVIREEKMVAAYELIEIYCELIVARLPIIESQKMCPIDLKEAVTSVIFAAPRCSDISELSDIRKHFTAKYGKEFVTSAIELRPDCGVSRLLIEKLSAGRPDIKTKIKVLSDVAKEHNITWDPTSFEEKESEHPNDLLDGPTNFETASTTNMDVPKVQASNIEVGYNHKEKQDAPVDFSQQNRRYTLGAQNTASTDTAGVEKSSAATDADMRSSGITSGRMERRQPMNNDFSSGRENWNMEFKDATSAAQAAAESAERAAMAARAAAQFSSHEKIAKQHPHVSDIRDRPSHVSAPPRDSKESFVDDRKPKNQHMDRSEAAESAERAAMAARAAAAQFSSHEKIAKQHPHVSDVRNEPTHGSAPYLDSKESFVDDRKHKIPKQQMDRSEAAESAERAAMAAARAATQFSGHETVASHHHPTRTGSHVYDGSLNNFHMADGYFDESLNEDRRPLSPKTTTHEGYEESKANLGSGQRSNFEFEDVNYFAEDAIKKQPSFGSSHSSTVSDEFDVPDHQKSTRKSVVGNPFAVVDQGNLFKEATKTSSNVDDEAVSDDDVGPRFDTGFEYDDVEANSSFLSPGRESPPRSLGKAQVSSKSHLFSESLSFPEVEYVGPSETDDHIQTNFDHSDGPDSESETEKGFLSRKNRIELNDLLEREPSEKRPSSFLLNDNGDQDSFDTLEDNNDPRDQSNDSDTTKELNFGTLTGGLRNKGGLKYPPYTKSTTDTSVSSKKSVGESSVTRVPSSLESSLDSGVSGIENKRPEVSMSSSDSDSDDYSDKHLVQSSKKASEQGNARSRFPPPAAFFDDDGSESEEEVSKQASSRVRLGSGLSRRTRGASSAPCSKSHVQPEPEPEPIISSFSRDKKPGPDRYSYSDEVPDEPRSYAGRFKEVSRRKTGESGPKAQENPEPETIIPSSSKDKKPSRYSYSDEVPDEPRSYAGRFKEVSTRKTGEIGSPKAQENPKPKPEPEPKMTFSSSSKDKKPSRDSYSDEVPYEPRPYAGRFKLGSTKSQENPGSRLYSNDTPSEPRAHSVSSKQDAVETKIPTREHIPASESGTKASHVHPKLPDYDSIAARLEALRTNRQ